MRRAVARPELRRASGRAAYPRRSASAIGPLLAAAGPTLATEAPPPVAGKGAPAGKAGSIMLGVVSLNGQYGAARGIQGALSLAANVPTLIVFIFFQRYLIKGMTMDAVKG